MDHRKISIAQTAEVKPIEALERDAVRDRILQRTLLFENLSVAPGQPAAPDHDHGDAVATAGQVETAEEETSDTPRSRVEAAAKAAVAVLDRLLTRLVDRARGGQDRGGVRPRVRVRGGAGAGRAGDDR